LGFSELKKKSLKPLFLFENKLREALIWQHGLARVKRVEKVFSEPAYMDLNIKESVSRENYFEQLKGSSVDESHFRLSQNVSLLQLNGYHSGDWWVQSLSASLPVKLAPMSFKGKTVLDVCCAPGGKSFQLADQGAILTSIDKSENRLSLMKDNLDRLKYNLDLICTDVFDYQPKKVFDIILLDPPCTATGTIGKNPDLQFLSPLDKLAELLDIQQKMLERCSGWLKDNGFIIYSVCSLLKEEGEEQIKIFLKNNKRYSVVHPRTQIYIDQEGCEIQKESGVRIMPFFEENIGGTEGFYIAYLRLKGKSS
jgi:16S rRNA (cytosine967-C5)-methyltransferase